MPKKSKTVKTSLEGDEDAETLAGIDRGLADARAGRVVPAAEVRRLVKKWIAASSTKRMKRSGPSWKELYGPPK